jgi:aryl-alcohol dehydrogenase-like predicted oxidoreductase
MQTQHLGTSNLNISRIGLGTMAFGRWISETDSFNILDHALDNGINLVDTADYYGPGQDQPTAFGDGTSETIIGHWLQQHPGRRNDMILATKVGQNTDPEHHHPSLSKAHIRTQIDGSLTRLHTNYLDLYQAHRFDDQVPLEKTLTTLSELVDVGKIRYYGVSNYTAEQLRAALDIIKARHLHPMTSVQNRYNLLTTKTDRPGLDFANTHNIGFLAYSPLARGVLTGKYLTGNVPADSRRAHGERLIDDYFNDQTAETVQRFKALADEAGVPMTQLAFAWLLKQPGITTALFGASKVRYFDDILAAEALQLSPDLVTELAQL